MPGKVIDFPNKAQDEGQEETVWGCTNCGNLTFILQESGDVRCSKCEIPHSDLVWGFREQDQM